MIYTRIIQLEDTIRAFTVVDQCGDHNIYINAKHSRESQLEAYKHELKHIEDGHFYSDENVSVIENFI